MVDVRGEVRIEERLQTGRALADQTERCIFGGDFFLGRDVVVGDHAFEHVTLPFARARHIHVWRIVRRRGRQAREHRGLGDGQVRDVRAEVGVRGRFDAVGARPEVDQVEIAFEDLVLGIVALDLHRQQRLLNLARDRDLVRKKEGARELLRDRRCALELFVTVVGQRRPCDTGEIDAVMGVEIPVLVGDERVADALWNL